MPTGVWDRDSVQDRLINNSKVIGECWEWVGSINNRGYGQIKYNGKNSLSHRVSYQIFVDGIEEGMTIDHLCCNKKCINPKHMEVVTNRENIIRGIKRRKHGSNS